MKKDKSVGTIELETAIDDNIIGGFVLQYGDNLFDASISSNLDDLKKRVYDVSYRIQF